MKSAYSSDECQKKTLGELRAYEFSDTEVVEYYEGPIDNLQLVKKVAYFCPCCQRNKLVGHIPRCDLLLIITLKEKELAASTPSRLQ